MRSAAAARLLCATMVFIGGCAVEGQPFSKTAPPPGNATIYVYRPYHYGGSLLRPPVTCGEDTARIGPGGYHAFVVPGGQKIECTVQGGETADQIELNGDARVYYIREEFGWGLWTGHPHLNPIDSDQANFEIQQCCVEERQPAP